MSARSGARWRGSAAGGSPPPLEPPWAGPGGAETTVGAGPQSRPRGCCSPTPRRLPWRGRGLRDSGSWAWGHAQVAGGWAEPGGGAFGPGGPREPARARAGATPTRCVCPTEHRCVESAKIRAKYPDRVPVSAGTARSAHLTVTPAGRQAGGAIVAWSGRQAELPASVRSGGRSDGPAGGCGGPAGRGGLPRALFSCLGAEPSDLGQRATGRLWAPLSVM